MLLIALNPVDNHLDDSVLRTSHKCNLRVVVERELILTDRPQVRSSSADALVIQPAFADADLLVSVLAYVVLQSRSCDLDWGRRRVWHWSAKRAAGEFVWLENHLFP
jgi:hypothetical protein